MKKFYLSASEASFAEEVPVEFKFLDGSLILVAGLLLGFPAHAGEGPIEASWAGAEGTDQLLMGREGLRWRVLCQRPIVSSDSSRSAKGKVKEVELEYARTKHAEALMGKNIEFNELDYQMCAMWHAPNTTSVERAELSAMRLDLLSARVRMMSGTLTQEQEDALRAKILGSMRPVEFSLQLEGLREDVDNLVLHLEDVDRRLAEIEASLATLQNQVAKLGGEIHLLEEKVKAGDKKLETKLNVLREEMNGKFVEIFALIKELQRNALTVPTLQRPSG